MSNTINLKNISNEDFEKVVIVEKKPTVLVFGAEWSGNSEIMNNMMARVSGEFQTGIQFFKVDIEQQTTISEFFSVHSVPTTILIKEGEIVDLVRGFLPASKVRKKIKAAYSQK